MPRSKSRITPPTLEYDWPRKRLAFAVRARTRRGANSVMSGISYWRWSCAYGFFCLLFFFLRNANSSTLDFFLFPIGGKTRIVSGCKNKKRWSIQKAEKKLISILTRKQFLDTSVGKNLCARAYSHVFESSPTRCECRELLYEWLNRLTCAVCVNFYEITKFNHAFFNLLFLTEY